MKSIPPQVQVMPEHSCVPGGQDASGDLILLSKSIRQDLKRERLRTGVSPRRLIGGMPNPPEGLSARCINGWLTERARSANRHHFVLVMAAYQALPDIKDMKPEERTRYRVGSNSVAARAGYIPLTSEMSQTLIAASEQTELRGKRLLRALSAIVPGVTAALLQAWRRGSVKSVDPVLWAATLAAYKQLPAEQVRITHSSELRTLQPITPEERRRIASERERTGVHPCALVRVAYGRPAFMSESIVRGWISGQTETADPLCISWVLTQYASLPDAEAGTRRSTNRLPPDLLAAGYRPVTTEERVLLRSERERTGVPATTLVNLAADAPKLLTGYTVNAWATGATLHADPTCIAWVLDRYRALPDRGSKL